MDVRHHHRGDLQVAAAVAALVLAPPALADGLLLLDSFNPSASGGLCGTGFGGDVWVYQCSSATIDGYATDGTFLGSITRPGEGADDVDVDFAPIEFVLGRTNVPAGALLFINGESGTADIYAVDVGSGDVIASLATDFGASHVVGGGFHADRGTFFLVQDSVPGAAGNMVAEVDPVDGTVLNTFSTIASGVSVFFGDLDVDPATGNLLVVSSVESSIAEFTPDGALVRERALPQGVSSLSGIAVDATGCTAWVGGTGGMVWQLRLQFCGADTDRSGVVDVVDLVNVVLAWGTADADADTNDDGLVDVLDLIQVILDWGPCACEAG